MLLCGDLGGTRARLALFSESGPLRPQKLKIYPSKDFRGVGHLIRIYLEETGARPEAAVLSLAGPVLGQEVHLTNLDWHVSVANLRRAFGFKKVYLLNDLEAAAYGIPKLRSRDLEILQRGRPPFGRVSAIVAPGTGLGEAILVRTKKFILALPTEGGHTEFPADNEEEWHIYQECKRRFGHASLERILSGPGLALLHEIFSGGEKKSPEEVVDLARKGYPPAEKAVRTLVRILGREAGNLALKSLALGGVYLAGGLSPTLLPWLKEEFLPAFSDKGRLRDLLLRIPVKVVLHPYPALFGAAEFYRHPSPLRV